MVNGRDRQVRDLYRNGNLVARHGELSGLRAGVGSTAPPVVWSRERHPDRGGEELITTTNPTGAFGATTDCATTALFDAQTSASRMASRACGVPC